MNEGNTSASVRKSGGLPASHGPALIAPPFPATARGKDEDGGRFIEEATLDDLRAHSLCLRLSHALAPGAALLIVIGIGADHPSGTAAPAVAIRGIVTQSTPLPLGGYAVVVSFDRYRFLYSAGNRE
jgi:hypothetical protein